MEETTSIVTIAVSVLSALAPLITAGVGWLGVRLSQLVAAKTKSQTAATAVLKLNDIVTTVVTELENTMVATAKERSASGSLDAAAGDAIKAAGVAKIKSYMGPAGLQLLATSFGIDPATVDQFIGSKLESAVYAVGNGANPTLPSTTTGGGATGTLPPFLAGATPSNPYGGAVADPSMSPNNVPVAAAPVQQAQTYPVVPPTGK